MPVILIGNSLDMHRAEKSGMHELPGSIHLGHGAWVFKVTTITPELRAAAEKVAAETDEGFPENWAKQLAAESSQFND